MFTLAKVDCVLYGTPCIWQKTSRCERMKLLPRIAKSQPQSAYSAYIHGEQHRDTYFLRPLPNITNLLKPLDETITKEFIPALFGSNILSR